MAPSSSSDFSPAVDVLLLNPYEADDGALFHADRLFSDEWDRLPALVTDAVRAGRERDAEKMLYAAAHVALRQVAYQDGEFEPPRLLTELLGALGAVAVPRDDVRRVAMALGRFYQELHRFAGRSVAARTVRALAWKTCFGASVHGALRSQARMFEQHILILGESGTGKELIAGAVQAGMLGEGDDAAPTQVLNAAALTPELANSELFGHERGAFTGAISRRRGKILDADGGTLFFDEVADLPLVTQGALLRVISSGVVVPVGANDGQSVNVRYVAATSKLLDQMVERNEFVPDLYQRLARQVIRIPPLRERPEDIEAIGTAVLREKGFDPERLDARARGREVAAGGVRPMSTAEALGFLRSSEWLSNDAKRYTWPGNARELRSCIINLLEGFAPNEHAARARPAPTTVGDVMLQRILDCAVTEEELRDWYFQRVLDAANGNQTEAERMLGKNRSTVGRRLKRLALEKAGSKGA